MLRVKKSIICFLCSYQCDLVTQSITQERLRSIVMSTFVCVSVCPRGYRRNHTRDFCHFLHVAVGRGSVFLCRRCDTLCTSGFVDDIMFFSIRNRILV